MGHAQVSCSELSAFVEADVLVEGHLLQNADQVFGRAVRRVDQRLKRFAKLLEYVRAEVVERLAEEAHELFYASIVVVLLAKNYAAIFLCEPC